MRRRDAHLDRELSFSEVRAFRAARSRSKKFSFELSLDEFRMIVASSAGRCDRTNILFSDERVEGMRIRPFRISLDRFDSSLGYTFDNCDLVCSIYNIAKNQASPQLIHTIMFEYARANGAEVPESMVIDRGYAHWVY